MKFSTVRRHALSLPDVTEVPHHHFSSFRVGGKIFVTVPSDEKYLHVFIIEEQREMALAIAPTYLEKLFWGAKVVGVRVELEKAEPAMIKRLVTQAWAHKAPKAVRERAT